MTDDNKPTESFEGDVLKIQEEAVLCLEDILSIINNRLNKMKSPQEKRFFILSLPTLLTATCVKQSLHPMQYKDFLENFIKEVLRYCEEDNDN